MTEHVSVLLVGLDEADAAMLAGDGGFAVRSVSSMSAAGPVAEDGVVLTLDATGPLESIRHARATAPHAALVVVTGPGNAADGSIALHAGAEDHLIRDEAFAALLPRAVRYAVAIRRVRRELSTVDEATELPNLRGFAPIAEHHLRMADRSQQPVVLIFIRLDDHARTLTEGGHEAAEALAVDAAGVLLEAVRDSDVPGRIADDTFVVLLTGEADGAETIVLSRLVEAIAVHDAARTQPRSLALSVGTARYVPGSGVGLADVLSSAMRGLSGRT